MRFKGIRLLLTVLTMMVMVSSVAYAKNVNMDLFYNGNNHAYSALEVKIMIDGEELIPEDIPPVIIEERTMLPMRLIAEELGCEVVWNEQTKQAFVTNDDYTLVFTLDSNQAIKNGEEFTLDVPAMTVNDRITLPVRALAKALELDITWDDPSRTVYIGEGAPTTTTTQNVKVTGVSVPAKTTATQTFSIEADGVINSYEEVYVDNSKVVIDIKNATNVLASKITATNSGIVTAIRSAQHETSGSAVTRVVFDLSGEREYTVTQGADKKKINITFEQAKVEDISLVAGSNYDRLAIDGDGALGASVSTLSNPYRIIVDIPNAKSEAESELSVSGLSFVTAARVGMYNDTTLRVVLETEELADYTWTEKNGEVVLDVKEHVVQNLSYNSTTNVLSLGKADGLDVNDIQKIDRHTAGYYEIVLPGNYENAYPNKTISVGNAVVNNISVSTKNGKTTIHFAQSRYNEYVMEETTNGYEIQVKNPKDVYDKVVLIDAGHGASDPGTSGNGLVEKNMNLTMALKVADYLKGTGVKVYMTRDSDTYPANSDRAKIANQIADLMVSIHFNSVAGNVTANGTETLYQVHANDNSSKLTSLKAATIMQSNLIQALGTTNRGVKQRTDLLILNQTTVPTILVETCFLSNPGDALKISSDTNQNAAAKAMANAIVTMLEDYKIR
ncbi:MAG: N-acetylmuramoyl-L-alanine amidase [Anaerotignum sp.]